MATLALENFNLIDNKFGRKVIYTAVPEITADNVVKVLQDALVVHEANKPNITYLEDYYTGTQPILLKTKTVRPEINNIVPENHAYEFVEFQVGQECGEPIQYVRRGKDESKSEKVQLLNDFMAHRSKTYWDSELSRWKHICGTAYRICFPDKNFDKEAGEPPFDIDVLDPKHTFVVYSSGLGKKPMMGATRTLDEENNYIYTCYTRSQVFKIKNDNIVDNQPNGVGKILIVETPNNSRRISTVELVIGITDAINNIQSNRVDGIEQFVQALIKFINCEIDKDTFVQLVELGAIKVKSEPGVQADVDIIAKELNQEQTQITKEDLYKAALIVLGMPDREQNTGGDTGQAVYLRNGWDFAEDRAENNEKPMEKAEKEFLSVALKILNNNNVLDLTLNDIDIKFNRSKTDNMVVKTQALSQQLTAGINPQIAIKTCELYSDPEDVYIRSREVMDAKFGINSVKKPEPVREPNNQPPQTGGDNNAGA
jgi:SPP1 family phage portal protein